MVASDGSTEKTATVSGTITGNTAILTFTDVAFGINAGDATYGRLFSIDEGRIYKDSQISNEMASLIDIAFGSKGYTMYYFESPDEADYQLTGASTTKVDNYVPESDFSVATFDAMTDDAAISSLTIEETNDSFGNSQPNIILFETAAGRKGVIKTTAVNADRILATIKVQKY